ncbi:MarR family winged helix-turn-helix transcriptional regulator [Cellulomonas edaphi]|uniref:MarR family transcriptional regulator n=1 Tax=Cellulomonas edaphi TaxID=3053468 RepID=A0ABT7SBH4_9CELL|nr:MarR family transcriptional regulator [Cellulomons edaphi]MDM7832309.1 MarR family transcriptional regulator [Cellulomons edaphi]
MVDENFRELERELGLFLRRAHSASAAVARHVHPDLEPAAYELLALIQSTPVVRASDLAARIGVGRGTMSRQLSRLAALGFVARRPDPEDFRGQLLSLTDEGRSRLEGAQAARRTYLRSALGDWSPSEVDDLTRQLGRLNGALTRARERAGAAPDEFPPAG